MDLVIFIVCVTFGLIMTLIGFRSSGIAVVAMLFNVILFGAIASTGLSADLAISTQVVTQTYDTFPAILLPALFAVLSFLKLVKFR